MTIEYRDHLKGVDWPALLVNLTRDNWNNGRSVAQLRLSFENSQHVVMVFDGALCVGNARALSDGVCNAFVMDVWTHSGYREQGIGTAMMNRLVDVMPGQHVYLFTDDQIRFYRRLGFTERGVGMEKISGTWLENASRNCD